ncbi:MAG: DUF3833 domain-containing protein [Halioglobus sp.]|nr:DUF3833 domain-containing protein [Halioglobus sp.]
MKAKPAAWVCVAFLVILNGCAAVRIEDYAENTPSLVAETFFNGQLTASGIVKDRSGRVIRYFNATIDASWENGVGTLDERFVFDDGEHQTRVWTLRRTGSGVYNATAGDVIGDSTMMVLGNSLFMQYVLRIPYGEGTIDIDVDDRMYQVSDTVLLNESVMSKWGVNVGQITLVIQKT